MEFRSIGGGERGRGKKKKKKIRRQQGGRLRARINRWMDNPLSLSVRGLDGFGLCYRWQVRFARDLDAGDRKRGPGEFTI